MHHQNSSVLLSETQENLLNRVFLLSSNYFFFFFSKLLAVPKFLGFMPLKFQEFTFQDERNAFSFNKIHRRNIVSKF